MSREELILSILKLHFPGADVSKSWDGFEAKNLINSRMQSRFRAWRYALESNSLGQLRCFHQEAIEKRVKLEQADAEERAFFNQPEADVDCQSAARLPMWLETEAAAFALGKDPEKVNPLTLAAFPYASTSPFCKNFEQSLKIINRAIIIGELSKPILPAAFISWADDRQFPVHAQLIAAVLASGTSITTWRTRHETLQGEFAEYRLEAEAQVRDLRLQLENGPTSASTDVRRVVAKDENKDIVIAAMAVKKYGYDPKRTRSNVVAQILQDISALGQSMDDATVRNMLRAACDWINPKFLPP
jgi:hypothetical protein